MILVTGASGKTGCAVVSALAKAAVPTRALVRRSSQIQKLKDLGACEIVLADMLHLPDLVRVIEGSREMYHICPNVNLNEIEIGRNVITAAREAGVEHLVLHSVLHPQAEKMPHHWNKLRVEETLLESGLDYTILQPTAYMQNLLTRWQNITEKGVLLNPYPVETRLSLVDLEDVAEAASRVLIQPDHKGATYELVGTPPLSQIEVAEILGDALDCPIRAEAESIDAWEEQARSSGLGDYQRDTLINMFQYYERYGLVGNSNALRCLLGREPTSLADFTRRVSYEKVHHHHTPPLP